MALNAKQSKRYLELQTKLRKKGRPSMQLSEMKEYENLEKLTLADLDAPTPAKADTAIAGERRTRTRSSASARPPAGTRVLRRGEAVAPTPPKQLATPKAPARVEPTDRIRGSVTPWKDRPKGGQFWAGLTEPDALRQAQDVHDHIQRRGLSPRDAEAEVRRQLNFNNDQAYLFARDAVGGRPISRFNTFGEAHTAGGEEMMADWIGQSRGNRTEMLADLTGRTQVTDLRNSGDLIDQQNIYSSSRDLSNPRMNIGVLKGYRDGQPGRFFEQASDSDTFGDIIEDFKRSFPGSHGDGKLMQTPDGAAVGAGDFNMTNNADIYGKDFLIGGVYDKGRPTRQRRPGQFQSQKPQDWTGGEFTNLTENINRGSYDPQIPGRVYSVDMPELRRDLLSRTKGDLTRHGIRVKSDIDLNINIPLEHIKKYGGGTNPMDHGLLNPDIADEISRSRAGGVQFGAEMLPGADKAIQGLKKNWRGGVGTTLVNGASREVGKKVAQGDWKGAIAEFGMTYGGGAMLESGLKGVANNGVVKKVGSAVAKRLPGVGARFAGGTAGSGGLLAPVMGVIGAVEVADGLVEGFTGKGTLDHAADNVRDTYTKTTGDKRSDEQIATAMTPQGVYKPEQVGGPKLTQDKISDISASLKKSTGVGTAPVDVPQVGVSTPQVKAQNNLMGWIKKINPFK